MAELNLREQLIALDINLKDKAERYAQHARRHPDVADAAWKACHDLLEQARGVRMAIQLVEGGKFLMGIIVPKSTLDEVKRLIESS